MKKYEKLAIEILEQVSETEGLEEDMDLNLFEAGLLDSLSVIAIIIQIEEKLGLVLEPTDFLREDIASVASFATFLAKREAE